MSGGRRGASARPWRLLAGTLAGVLILAALAVGALRLALAQVPGNAARIQAWIEQQTGYRLEYRELDARLRWWGPEVVLRNARVLDRDDPSQALFEAREGTVSLDVWNLFRTGELVAGRVRVVAPQLTVVRLADGRIRLLGQRERPIDRAPFDLDRLPAGRVEIVDATLHYRDLRAGTGQWTLPQVQLSLRRAHDAVDVEGIARLPEDLGTRLAFEGRLRGSLERFADLVMQVELRAEDLNLAGVGDLLPQDRGRPLAGTGSVTAAVEFDHGRLGLLRVDAGLRDVTLALPPRTPSPVTTAQVGPPTRLPGASALSMPLTAVEFVERPAAALPQEARYAALEGRLRLRRDGDAWILRANELRLQRGPDDAAPPVDLAVRWQGHPSTTWALDAYAGDVDLATVWPLVLAFAPPAFDRWSGLDPAGRIHSLRAELRRERAGSRPRFTVALDAEALAARPVARWPGFAGLNLRASGTEAGGTLALHADDPSFEWPRLFREPILAGRAAAEGGWRGGEDEWLLELPGFEVEHPQAAAQGSFALRLPAGGASPHLDLDVRVGHLDATLVSHVLPVGRLKERSLAWLDAAFRGGTARDGVLSYHGPVRRFPFREGEGDFRASATVDGAVLEYFPGFAPLSAARGVVEFHNAGLTARVEAGEVGGLRLLGAEVSIPDLKAPEITIDGRASGDVSNALAVLQTSPLGPRLGTQFMTLAGQGPGDYALQLFLPTQDTDARDYRVRAKLNGVSVSWPLLRTPATGVRGELEIHNREVSAPALRGTLLDGPFELSVRPGPLRSGVTASVLVQGSGRMSGARLPALIGLPDGIRMSGTTEWRLEGRIERHGDGEQWPARFAVASELRGLGIDAPSPFAKPAGDARPTRVALEVPGRTQAGVARTEVRVESGSARAALLFAERPDGRWHIERGAARFDAQPVVLPARPGLQVGGAWPEFDLAEWLALRRGGASAGPVLSDWLGRVDVHLDRARILGFEFDDVTARLEPRADAWRVEATGPMAEGTVTVPTDFSRGVLGLSMRRLVLRSAPRRGTATDDATTDPRTLPGISADAEEFTWQGRRFGQLSARIEKVPQGLRLASFATRSSDFTLDGTGSWLAEAGGTRTRLALDFSSDDFAAASRALGYREAVEAGHASARADVSWSGGPAEDVLTRLDGEVGIELTDGQLRSVKPGAGRVLGLLSVLELPRRLSLDFRDVTDEGLAFDAVRGDFSVRAGNAHTENLLVKGPAVDVGLAGRTGLATQDYDLTMVVSGNYSGPITVAGALAGGPVGAAGALLISQLFKGQLQGLARVYYRVTGPWANPKVERITAAETGSQAAANGPAATEDGR